MARRSGGGQHNERNGAEVTMQGNWAADGTAEGGGVDNARALVVDSFWQQREGVHSRRPQNCTSKLYLKSCKTPLRKPGFSRRVLHDLRYDLMYNKSYLKSYQFFVCDRMGLITVALFL